MIKENFGVVNENVRIKLQHYCEKKEISDGKLIASSVCQEEDDGRFFLTTLLDNAKQSNMEVFVKNQVDKCPFCNAESKIKIGG